ncbi:MAG: GNAT family N-acetyltransferase [Asticcacaulis sp.]
MTPVTLSDIPALSALARLTFTETFAHLYPPADLQHFLDTAYSEAALAQEVANPDHFIRIIYDADHQPQAYIQATPVCLPYADADPDRHGEIKRLYVRQSAQARGLGKQLLSAGLDYLSTRYPSAPQWIGVWSENHKAQSLYASYGFTKVSEYGFPVGETIDLEYILRRR